MNYIRMILMDELHPYVVILTYGYTSSVYNLWIYFIRMLIIPDLLEYQLLKENRKMCTSAQIKPLPVRLSPPPNRYLSQHLQKRPPTRETGPQWKEPSFQHNKNIEWVPIYRKTVRDIIGILKMCWVHRATPIKVL